ncbi:MAG TPA: insulinase family protein, partial [Bacteroidales bacterium]|nr:insulinase family protein [Bacteroidales bacterium]
PLGGLQLQRARQQLKGQIAIAGESNLNLMLALGKSVLSRDRTETLEDVYRRIDAIGSDSLLEVAREALDPSIFSRLIFRTPE